MNRAIDLLFLLLAIIVIYYRYTIIKIPPPQTDQPYEFSGQLLQVPRSFGNYQSFKIGQIYITTRYPPEYQYGEMLTVSGILTPKMTMGFPKIVGAVRAQPATDIAKSDVSGTARCAPTFRSNRNGSEFLSVTIVCVQNNLLKFRNQLTSAIGHYLPSPEAELVSGILWGEKANLPQDFNNNLKRTGTIHMVVVSGYNIAVVAALLLGLFRVFGRKISLVLTILGIVTYTLLTGAEAPSVRAAIMGGIAVLGTTIGRERTALRLLVIAAAVMLLINPLFIEDLGFQLSFLATLGIVLFGNTRTPSVGANHKNISTVGANHDSPPIRAILESPLQELRTTLAAQVLVIPLLATTFGQVSLISPVANILVGWTVPILMAGGAVLTIPAILCTGEAPTGPLIGACLTPTIIGSIIFIPATFFTTVVSILGSLSWAAVDIHVGTAVIIGYYAVVGMWVIYKRTRSLIPSNTD